ncbi:MAG TPA: hypothetical protein VEW66_01035 [Thermomicrobiales bacterium]|nr:hypothetical protein [Thermomicrobiales bacterium]
MSQRDDLEKTGRRRPAPGRQDASILEETVDAPDDEHMVYGLGIPNAESRQPAYGQGVVVSLLVAGLVLLLAIVSIGSDSNADPPVFNTTDTLFWALAFAALVLAAGGSWWAERTAARAAEQVGQPRAANAMATAWVVPLVSTFAAIFLVATYHNRAMLIIGPLIAFLGTAGALLSRDLLDETDDQATRVAAVIHTLVVHAIAFLAFSAVYINKLDSWISAPLVGIIGGLLILETLERGGIAPPQRVFYAVLGGLVLAESMVALNWWPTYGWTGGAVLLVVFYVAAGLLLVRAQRKNVSMRDLIEFCGVGSVFLLLLAVLA